MGKMNLKNRKRKIEGKKIKNTKKIEGKKELVETRKDEEHEWEK
jgi:hypothetical protein